MDVVEKVREGLENFLDSEKSENFKAIGGSEEISKLTMSDDNFIEAIIEGSMEYDTQSFFFKKLSFYIALNFNYNEDRFFKRSKGY